MNTRVQNWQITDGIGQNILFCRNLALHQGRISQLPLLLHSAFLLYLMQIRQRYWAKNYIFTFRNEENFLENYAPEYFPPFHHYTSQLQWRHISTWYTTTTTLLFFFYPPNQCGSTILPILCPQYLSLIQRHLFFIGYHLAAQSWQFLTHVQCSAKNSFTEQLLLV